MAFRQPALLLVCSKFSSSSLFNVMQSRRTAKRTALSMWEAVANNTSRRINGVAASATTDTH